MCVDLELLAPDKIIWIIKIKLPSPLDWADFIRVK